MDASLTLMMFEKKYSLRLSLGHRVETHSLRDLLAIASSAYSIYAIEGKRTVITMGDRFWSDR